MADSTGGATHVVRASRRALIKVAGALYSVPCEWASLEVTAHVGPSAVEIVGPRGMVRHPRQRFGERAIDYRHYLRELARKPQAVRQVAAELIQDLGEPFAGAWRTLVDAPGPGQAARIFAKVLGHVEARGLTAVAETLTAALRRGAPLLLALAPAAAPPSVVARETLPASLRAVEVTCGSAADYDAWLRGGA